MHIGVCQQTYAGQFNVHARDTEWFGFFLHIGNNIAIGFNKR